MMFECIGFWICIILQAILCLVGCRGHTPQRWTSRYRNSCSRIRLFRASRQNMRECLGQTTVLLPFLLTPVISIFFSFPCLSSLTFSSSSSSGSDHSMVLEYGWRRFLRSLSHPLYFHLASHYSGNEYLQLSFPDWPFFFRFHSYRISLPVHASGFCAAPCTCIFDVNY